MTTANKKHFEGNEVISKYVYNALKIIDFLWIEMMLNYFRFMVI